MAEKEEIMDVKKTSDISVLSHEITYRRYLMDRGRIKEVFEK